MLKLYISADDIVIFMETSKGLQCGPDNLDVYKGVQKVRGKVLPKDKVHEWPKSALYQKLMKFGHKIDVGLLRSKMHF